MDHLARTFNRPVKQIPIPLILSPKIYYDGLGFYGFPERKSISPSELWSPSSESRLSDIQKLGFLQAWLYFGFANEVFGRILVDTPMPLEVTDLVSQDGNGSPRINSTSLYAAVSAWMASEEYTSPEVRQERRGKIEALVDDVRQILDAIVTAKQLKKITYLGDDGEMLVGDLVVIGISLLGEQIQNSIRVTYGETAKFVYDVPFPMTDSVEICLLQLSNLCANEGAMILKSRAFVYTTLVYTFMASQITWRKDHTKCSNEECVAARASDKPAHVDPDCSCCMTSMSVNDQNLLLNLIRDGSIPMLTVHQSPGSSDPLNIKLQLSKFDPSDPTKLCIAISHVWSGMLGNPATNAMPACQLKKLQRAVQDVLAEYANHHSSSATTIGFWIDTVCVPHDKEVKPLALDQMHDLYKNSSGVLVLDSQIQRTSTDLDWGTCLWQIYTSPWSRRLWTLQEGILNEHTYFAFADNFWTIRHLIASYDHADQLYSTNVAAYREFLAKHRPQTELKTSRAAANAGNENSMNPMYRLMRTMLLNTIQIPLHAEQRISRLLHELVWRTTSYSSDESICLAILLNLDIPELLAIPPANRLSHILKVVGRCPSNLLFVPCEKQELPGFRWMPQTFLNQRRNLLISGTHHGVVTDEGLVLDLPSLHHTNEKTISINVSTDNTVYPHKIRLTLESLSYDIVCVGDPTEVFKEFFGGLILLPHNSKPHSFDVGCFCKIVKVENGVTYIEPVRCCIIRGQETVYRIPEAGSFQQIEGPGQQGRPVLSPQSVLHPLLETEATFVPSTRFCVI